VPTEPAIVFEGNLPANAEQNSTLANVLAAPIRPDPGYAARAWLGAAVAIKEPTSVTFRRQSGNNLLIVGQQEEAALGMLATCLVSLAAQYAPRGTQPERQGAPFIMLNGAAPDAWQTGWLQDFLDVLPHGLALVDPHGAAQTIADVAAELARRQNSATDDAAPMYLLIYNLARFRNLRRAEDDFGLPNFAESEQKSTAQQFGVILTEGPSLGIHTLMWCDSSNNVHRYLSRQMLRDVEMRVLFQISEADSTSLIDTPVAGRLGQHRAILYSAEHGTLEKFRPYGPPSRKWLDAVRDNLHRHAIASR